jgi:hypothetical protein
VLGVDFVKVLGHGSGAVVAAKVMQAKSETTDWGSVTARVAGALVTDGLAKPSQARAHAVTPWRNNMASPNRGPSPRPAMEPWRSSS